MRHRGTVTNSNTYTGKDKKIDIWTDRKIDTGKDGDTETNTNRDKDTGKDRDSATDICRNPNMDVERITYIVLDTDKIEVQTQVQKTQSGTVRVVYIGTDRDFDTGTGGDINVR